MANLFPKATNLVVIKAGFVLSIVGGLVTLAVWYYFTPKYSRVGYQPTQPVYFQHDIHVGQLGLDCRYCHSQVEKSGFSNYPPTQTCMTCHSQIWSTSPMLEPVRASYRDDKSIEWIRVNAVPDFVYFNHSIHVNKGVGCVTCHGPVGDMPLTWRANTLQMGWCLDCHRNPEKFVRPKENVFDIHYKAPANQEELGLKLMKEYKIQSLTNCTTCHR
jgi:hypothetical protein